MQGTHLCKSTTLAALEFTRNENDQPTFGRRHNLQRQDALWRTSTIRYIHLGPSSQRSLRLGNQSQGRLIPSPVLPSLQIEIRPQSQRKPSGHPSWNGRHGHRRIEKKVIDFARTIRFFGITPNVKGISTEKLIWILGQVQPQLESEEKLSRIADRLPLNPDTIYQVVLQATGDKDQAELLRAKAIMYLPGEPNNGKSK